MFPVYYSPDIKIHVRNIHRHKIIHGAHRITTISYTGDLMFYSPKHVDPIEVAVRIEKTQIFPSDNAQQDYYKGNRELVNLFNTPSYYLTYHITEISSILDSPVLNFIMEGINKVYPCDEFEFFGPLKSGRWFFLDGEAEMMESEINDANTIDGVQYYFFSNIESVFDTSKLSNEIYVTLSKSFSIKSVEVGKDFWFYYAYITFSPYSSVIDIENNIRQSIKKLLSENSFIFFGGESIPPVKI